MSSPKKNGKNFMNNNERAAEMAKWVKMLAAKPKDLSLVPEIQIMETT